MNNTHGDLKAEYERQREAAKRFGAWDGLDAYVDKLIAQIAPKVEKPVNNFVKFAYDDMGLALHVEPKDK